MFIKVLPILDFNNEYLESVLVMLRFHCVYLTLQSLEELSIEKQVMKEKYERELEGLRNVSNHSQKELLQQHEAELEKLRQQMQAHLAAQKLEAEENLDKVKQVRDIENV